MSQNETKHKMQLKLSDIIKIISPQNEMLNDKIFLIDYIDTSKIVIIGTDNLEEITLRIHEDGHLGDGSIKQIELLKRNDKEGYARQNNLLPGTWLNITFNGEEPFILIGEITNLEEDMIELKTYPDDETIFIDFGYKGIPEDLPIQSIEIRNPPEDRIPANIRAQILSESSNIVPSNLVPSGLVTRGLELSGLVPSGLVPSGLVTRGKQSQRTLREGTQGEGTQGELEEGTLREGEEGTLREGEEGDQGEGMEEGEIFEDNRNILEQQVLEADEIIFGNYLDPVQEFRIIDKDKYRYDLQEQTNSLLEDMMAKLPNNKRTDSTLDLIHLLITRFLQLRKEYSIFNENGNIVGFIKKSATFKPLTEYLSTMQNSLSWIYYVTTTKKKIYDEEEFTNMPKDTYEVSNNESMLNIENIFKDYKGGVMEYENNYAHLYTAICDEMQPFAKSDTPNIISGEVSQNVIGITDNLGNMYSTTYSDSSVTRLVENIFFLQQYNVGLTRLKSEGLKGARFNPKIIPMTNNDSISINSILTLPEPFVRYSKIRLPQTDILIKANLNRISVPLSKFLNKKTLVQTIDVTDLDIDFNYKEGNFLNNIKKFNLQLEEPSQLSSTEIFKKYLNVVIPKTKVLFSLSEKYIEGSLSIVHILDYLEPFMIYSNDLSFKQYNIFNFFINTKISEYNKNYVTKSRFFNNLRSVFTHKKPAQPLLVRCFSDNYEIKMLVSNYYGFNEKILTSEEMIIIIMKLDEGKFFNACLSFINLHLLISPGITQQLHLTENKLNSKMSKDLANNPCENTSTLAKIYRTQQELENDNNKIVYYDSSLDTTDYSILNKFKKEQRAMDFNGFLVFLTEKVSSLYPNIKNPEKLAETLILGKKEIVENTLAYNSSSQETYKRVGNVWVKDDTSVSSVMNNNTLCLVKEQCVDNDGMNKTIEPNTCISTSVMKEQLMADDIAQMLENFDKNYQYNQSKLKYIIQDNITSLAARIQNLRIFQSATLFKYNFIQYNLGVDRESKEGIELSPYLSLFDNILGLGDYSQKQSFIIKFCQKFTRTFYPNSINLIYNEEESKYWRYCLKTNTKLVPTFILDIAEVYFNNRNILNETIDQIIAVQGKLSDDGDSWVDEHSGRVIKMINMVEEEDYDEGFKIKSRGILEEDEFKRSDINIVIDSPENLNPLSKVIYTILNSLATNSFVNIEHKYPFIMNMVTNLILNPNIIETEESYKGRILKSAKKLPPYEFLFNSTLLYLTSGMFIIATQTTIPSIQTRRTFPGCVRSFTGFPLNGEGDLSTLTYVSCILFNIKTPEAPWNILRGAKPEMIGEKIKFFMTKYLLTISDIQNLIVEKNEYLQSNLVINELEEINLKQWNNFLPPLKPIHIKTITPPADNYKNSIIDDLKRGNYKQHEKILVLQSKIIFYSLEIIQFIQNLVKKKTMLLVAANSPYLENACCNENNTIETTLEYFIKQNPQIEKNNEIVFQISLFLNDVVIFSNASMFLCIEDTKLIYPAISSSVSENTMFKSLIYYCNYNSLLPIPLHLINFCKTKPTNLDSKDEMDIQITKLKNNAIEFSKKEFLKLIQLVGEQNSLSINMNAHAASSLQIQRIFFNNFSHDHDYIFPAKFINLMKDTLDSFDVNVDEPSVRDLRNYLDIQNQTLKKDIIQFIQYQTKISKNEMNKIQLFLDKLDTWNGKKYDRLDESSFYNYIQFNKNLICLFMKTIPNMIMTNSAHRLSCPSYWGLSKKHISDLKLKVAEFYDNYNKFFNMSSLTPILQSILAKSNILIKATINLTSFFPFEKEDSKQSLLFDKRTSSLILNFYVLSVFKTFIYFSSHSNDLTLSEIPMLAIPTEEESLGEMFHGEKKMIKEITGQLLTTLFQTAITIKKNIDFSGKDIEKMVFRLVQAEKNTYTERLEQLTQEERDAENILKLNKLGVWNKGLLKGLKEYDPENYDQERDLMYKISQIERRVRTNEAGNIREDLMGDLLEEEINELEIEKEIDANERNIRMLPADYYDGQYMGDEKEDEDYNDDY